MGYESDYNMDNIDSSKNKVENIQSDQILRALTVLISIMRNFEEQFIDKHLNEEYNTVNYRNFFQSPTDDDGKIRDKIHDEKGIFHKQFVPSFCQYIVKKYITSLNNTPNLNLDVFSKNTEPEQRLLITENSNSVNLHVKAIMGSPFENAPMKKRREQRLDPQTLVRLMASKQEVDSTQSMQRKSDWYNAENSDTFAIPKDKLKKDFNCPCAMTTALEDKSPAWAMLATYTFKFLLKLLNKFTIEILVIDYIGHHLNGACAIDPTKIPVGELVRQEDIDEAFIGQSSTTVLSALDTALVYLLNNFEIGDDRTLTNNIASCKNILIHLSN